MNGLAPRYITNATLSCFLRHAEDKLQFWVYKTKTNHKQLKTGFRTKGSNNTRKGTTMIVAIVLYNLKLFYLNSVISTKIPVII